MTTVNWASLLVLGEVLDPLSRLPLPLLGEDLGWLQYADWLEESGDEREARGVRRWLALPIRHVPIKRMASAPFNEKTSQEQGKSWDWIRNMMERKQEVCALPTKLWQRLERSVTGARYKMFREYLTPWDALSALFSALGGEP